MANKTVNLNARMDPELKSNAESVFAKLGLSASGALTLFYKQVVMHNGLPFSVTIPHNKPLEFANLNEDEIDAKIQKGINDIKSHNTISASKANKILKKELDL